MRDGLVQSRTQLINTVRSWMRKTATRCARSASENFTRRLKEARQELPSYVLRQLDVIDLLSASIEAADDELAQLVKADETCPRLMTVPGVGPVTAMRFVATIDDVKRFKTAHDVQAYLGLVPGEHSSGERKRRTAITKAGNGAMRSTLVQAAWSMRRARKHDPMVLWASEVEKRRGKQVATIALARKLVGVMYALWRDGSHYDSHHAAKQRAVPTT
jgi:transposase